MAAQIDPSDKKIEMRQVVRRGVIASQVVTNLVGRVATTSTVPRVVTSTSVIETNIPALARPPVPEPVVVQTTNPPAPSAVPPTVSGTTDNPAPALARLIEAFPVKPTANKLVVGISWSASVDLDLWVRANPSARDLYFNDKATREGRYLHDWRNRNLGVDYEYVELDADPALDLTKVGAWVNYYDGKAPTVCGVVIVFYQGHAYHGEFTLSAPGGNKATDKGKRDQSRYWVKLDLLKIVGLDGASNGDLSRR